MPATDPDVIITPAGNLYVFRLQTDRAWAWVERHVPEPRTVMLGALIVEARYARPLADGMVEDGLVVR